MTFSRLAVLLLGLVACDDDGDPIQPPDDPDPFEPGVSDNWDIQLSPPFDTGPSRELYVLDLWDVTTATTIDYGGGSTVTVPAGPLAGAVTQLQARGTTVVCHVEAGAIRLDDPDAARFPGHMASPPDRDIPPAAGSVIGWSIIGDPNTRYLDLTGPARAMWTPIMFKRFELAAALGCDAVAVSWVDQIDAGFATVTQDRVDYFTEIVADLDMRGLIAGMHVKTMVGYVLTDGFDDTYDFAIVERCAEFDLCDAVRSFEQVNKAVFGYDFDTDDTTDRDGDGIPDGLSFLDACDRVTLPTDWIHKDLDAAFRPGSSYRKPIADCNR